MSTDKDSASEQRAAQRGRDHASREILLWRLAQIHEAVFGLTAGDLSAEDRAYNYGRIEELSK